MWESDGLVISGAVQLVAFRVQLHTCRNGVKVNERKRGRDETETKKTPGSLRRKEKEAKGGGYTSFYEPSPLLISPPVA